MSGPALHIGGVVLGVALLILNHFQTRRRLARGGPAITDGAKRTGVVSLVVPLVTLVLAEIYTWLR